jgi:hypothetical protein
LRKTFAILLVHCTKSGRMLEGYQDRITAVTKTIYSREEMKQVVEKLKKAIKMSAISEKGKSIDNKKIPHKATRDTKVQVDDKSKTLSRAQKPQTEGTQQGKKGEAPSTSKTSTPDRDGNSQAETQPVKAPGDGKTWAKDTTKPAAACPGTTPEFEAEAKGDANPTDETADPNTELLITSKANDTGLDSDVFQDCSTDLDEADSEATAEDAGADSDIEVERERLLIQ